MNITDYNKKELNYLKYLCYNSNNTKLEEKQLHKIGINSFKNFNDIYHTYYHRLSKPIKAQKIQILFSKNVGKIDYTMDRIMTFFLNDDIRPFVLDKNVDALILQDYGNVFPSITFDNLETEQVDNYNIVKSVCIKEIFLFSKKPIENDVKCAILINQ